MFSCHVDVVPATPEFASAFAPRIDGDVIWGRGACDSKNNLIMLVEAVRYLREEGIPLSRTPLLDLPIEEEIGGNGALSNILHSEHIDDAICLEPTPLPGFPWSPRLSHVQGHCSRPRACTWAAARREWMPSEERSRPSTKCDTWKPAYLRRPETIQRSGRGSGHVTNIGIIQGGEWSGSIPERCTFRGDLGFLPSSSLDEVAEMIEPACRSVDDTRCRLRPRGRLRCGAA